MWVLFFACNQLISCHQLSRPRWSQWPTYSLSLWRRMNAEDKSEETSWQKTKSKTCLLRTDWAGGSSFSGCMPTHWLEDVACLIFFPQTGQGLSGKCGNILLNEGKVPIHSSLVAQEARPCLTYDWYECPNDIEPSPSSAIPLTQRQLNTECPILLSSQMLSVGPKETMYSTTSMSARTLAVLAETNRWQSPYHLVMPVLWGP